MFNHAAAARCTKDKATIHASRLPWFCSLNVHAFHEMGSLLKTM